MVFPVLKRLFMAIVSLVTLTVTNHVYSALIYNEVGDAGITAETAQHIPLGTTTIFGALHPNDGADVYDFYWDGGLFSASTEGSDFDTMLSIFDESGQILAFNDDFIEGGGVSLVSAVLNPGDYLLGISYYDNNVSGNLSQYSNAGIEASYKIEASPAAGPTTVAEPASIALLGIGLAGIAFSRRKKHNLP